MEKFFKKEINETRNEIFKTVQNMAFTQDVSVYADMYFDAIYHYMVNQTDMAQQLVDNDDFMAWLMEMRDYVYSVCTMGKEMIKLIHLSDMADFYERQGSAGEEGQHQDNRP